MGKRIRIFITVVFAVSLTGCGDDDTGTAEAAPDFLAVMHAASGSFSPAGEDFVLTLRDLAPRVIAFADRPDRVAAELSTSAFIDAWRNEYEGDPPNAALTVPSTGEAAATIVLTLEPPELDGRSVRFQAEQVTAPPQPLGRFRKHAVAPTPSHFDASSLFIDGGGLMQIVSQGPQNGS